MTGTPCVSSHSSVAGRSRMALAPAHTTATGVRTSSGRSAEMSVAEAAGRPSGPICRWTPPMPPVAKTRMPAQCAAIMVPATVVAPSRFWLTTAGKSRRLTFHTPSARARCSSSAWLSPTFTSPCSMAMVAGVAPPARTAASMRWASARLSGQGSPWLMTVDSSATSGRQANKASRTSGVRVGRG